MKNAIAAMAKVAGRMAAPAFMALALASSAVAQSAQAQQPPTKADRDAFFSIATDGQRTLEALETKRLADVKANADDKRYCADSIEYASASQDVVRKLVDRLRTLAASGTSATEFERTLLVWSDVADHALMSRITDCDDARYPMTDGAQFDDVLDAQSAQYLSDFLVVYETAKADTAKARTDNDRLIYLLRLQTTHTYLKTVLDYIDAHRHSGPKLTAAMAKVDEPALKTEYASVHDKYQRKIAAILHPGAPDPDDPFVYRPLVVPAVPDNDQAFLKQATVLAENVMDTSTASIFAGRPDANCAHARFARADNQALMTYGQAYLKARRDTGADTTTATKFLEQQQEKATAFSIDTSAEDQCYLLRAEAQSSFGKAMAGLADADARQRPLLDAMDSAVAANSDAGLCQASIDLRRLLEEMMIHLEVIKALLEPDAQQPDKADELARANNTQGKVRDLLLRTLEVEDSRCALIPPDRTLD